MWIPRWQEMVDLVVVATAAYLLLIWAKEARALRVAVGIVALRVAALVSLQLNLPLTTWVLDAASAVALVLLLVIFQPELRRALLQLDLGLRRRRAWSGALTPALISICDAAFSLASTGRGALIVLVHRDSVDLLVSGGVPLGGTVSKEILEAVFRKVSPVHDGATIIESDRISRVAAILPLSESPELPSEFGTRHRAAFGLAERCDASVIVVSEERGAVTLVHGHQHWHLAHVEDLVRRLQSFDVSAVPAPRSGWLRNLRLKAIALALGIFVWAVSLAPAGASVRNVLVPVEFTNVPAGMQVRLAPDNATVQVQLRARSWLFEVASLNRLAVRIDLRNARTGKMSVRINPAQLLAPPGIVVERISPDAVQIELAAR